MLNQLLWAFSSGGYCYCILLCLHFLLESTKLSNGLIICWSYSFSSWFLSNFLVETCLNFWSGYKNTNCVQFMLYNLFIVLYICNPQKWDGVIEPLLCVITDQLRASRTETMKNVPDPNHQMSFTQSVAVDVKRCYIV